MTDTFTLKDTTTFKEYLSILYYQIFRKRIVKGIFVFLTIISLVSVLLGFVLQERMNWYKAVFNLLLAPVFLIAFVYVVGFLVAILLWKFKPAIFNTTNKFTHWGMERTGEGFEISIPWNKFLRYKETKKYLLLFITKDDALVIQKKIFESTEQLEDFRKLISEKISVTKR